MGASRGGGVVCSTVQDAIQNSKGSAGSLPHGVITELAFELCLEKEASLKGDKRAGVPGKD